MSARNVASQNHLASRVTFLPGKLPAGFSCWGPHPVGPVKLWLGDFLCPTQVTTSWTGLDIKPLPHVFANFFSLTETMWFVHFVHSFHKMGYGQQAIRSKLGGEVQNKLHCAKRCQTFYSPGILWPKASMKHHNKFWAFCPICIQNEYQTSISLP